MYQLYFYVNLFNPLEDSSIINEKGLSEKTIEKLLNEILTEQNSLQRRMIFVEDRKTKLERPVENHNLFLQEIVRFGQVLPRF